MIPLLSELKKTGKHGFCALHFLVLLMCHTYPYCVVTQADELLQALKDEYLLWTAQYLVMKRASIEPNFHPLYSSFLDTLNKITLYKRVLLETHRNIKVSVSKKTRKNIIILITV